MHHMVYHPCMLRYLPSVVAVVAAVVAIGDSYCTWHSLGTARHTAGRLRPWHTAVACIACTLVDRLGDLQLVADTSAGLRMELPHQQSHTGAVAVADCQKQVHLDASVEIACYNGMQHANPRTKAVVVEMIC